MAYSNRKTSATNHSHYEIRCGFIVIMLMHFFTLVTEAHTPYT